MIMEVKHTALQELRNAATSAQAFLYLVSANSHHATHRPIQHKAHRQILMLQKVTRLLNVAFLTLSVMLAMTVIFLLRRFIAAFAL